MSGERQSAAEAALAANEQLRRELKAARLRVSELEAELRAAQRLEAVGRVASGIAHDFSNVIAVIAGYADLLLRRVDVTDPVRASAEAIKKATTWGQQLTQHVIASGRPQALLAPEGVDLNAVTSSVLRTLTPLFGDHIQLTTRLDPTLGLVSMNPGQLEQVVMNLLVNARDALAGGGRLTVETSAIELDPGSGRRAVPAVRLRVTDTGPGMDSETRARVFEPYFTTKEAGKGSGLGMSTVFGIVTQHGGQIAVASEVGEGATFTLDLPRTRAEAEPAAGAVLVIESEPGVRALIVEILQSTGYEVVQARDVREAIAARPRQGGLVHLLIADVSALGPDAERVAADLAAVHPGLKILYVSGDLEDTAEELRRGRPGRGVIHKPFTVDSLMRKVRALLITG